MKSSLTILLIASFAVFTSCSTTSLKTPTAAQVEKELPTITNLTATGTKFAITSLKPSAGQIALAYTLADSLRKLSGNTPPSPTDLTALLTKYTGSNSIFVSGIALLVSNIYSDYYAKLGGNAKLGVEVLNALATGVTNGVNATNPAAS